MYTVRPGSYWKLISAFDTDANKDMPLGCVIRVREIQDGLIIWPRLLNPDDYWNMDVDAFLTRFVPAKEHHIKRLLEALEEQDKH